MDFMDKVLANYDRRKHADGLSTACGKCLSQQVQLVSWLTDDVKFKCRKCKHCWVVHSKWEHSF